MSFILKKNPDEFRFSCLSKKEKWERKAFLVFLLLELVYFVIWPLLGQVFFLENLVYSDMICIFFYSLYCFVLYFYLQYHCVYKKLGTNCILFYMVFFYPCTFFIVAFLWLYNCIALAEFCIWISFSAVFYFFGFKFFSMNRKMNAFEFVHSDFCKKWFDVMLFAKDVKELDSHFHKAFKDCPKRFTDSFSSMYKERKKNLLKEKKNVL